MRSFSGHRHNHHSYCGFSMVELLIVMAIIVVITVMALPSIVQTVGIIRMRGATSSISSLVQNGRSLAVRRSRTKAVHVTTVNGTTVMFTQNCISANCTGNIGQIIPGEDEILYLPKGFVPDSSAPTLDESEIWGNSATTGTADIAFTPRGLPCDLTQTACVGPRGFIKYFSYSPGGKTTWIALTVSPAGRIKSYYWNGSKWGD